MEDGRAKTFQGRHKRDDHQQAGHGQCRQSSDKLANLELDIDEFIGHVRKGHAFSAHFKDGYRKGEKFLCSDVVAADVDGTMTLEDALEAPFVRDFAAFLYTTPSHTDDRHRFRIVFLLEETIGHSKDWKNCLLGLAVRIGSDRSIKDAGRMFYGNRDAQVYPIGKMLSVKEVNTLVALGEDERGKSHKAMEHAPIRSSARINPDTLVMTATGQALPFKDLPVRTSVLCPYHIDGRPSAFVVKSFSGNSTGIHCKACDRTFWPRERQGYDFDLFDQLIDERRGVDFERKETQARESSFMEQFFPPEPSVEVQQSRFLPKLDYRPGITLVKSPKGSGKTEALKGLLSQIRRGQFRTDLPKNQHPKSILLVGHRQSLLREAARKLGLACYLDAFEYEEMREGFATCLDSLHKVTNPSRYGNALSKQLVRDPLRYDVVIMDESEQVFSHLTADTLAANKGTDQAFDALTSVVSRAKAVYALDADLGLITAHALKSMRPGDWKDHCRIIFNKPIEPPERRTLLLFEQRDELEAKLVKAVEASKRCFVVSNSKKAIDTLEQIIVDKCGDAVKRRKITSDNSRHDDERKFVLNLTEKFLDIQVLLCSPSLGTGIDITFPNGEQKVDHVFGFFYPFVNTHTDIDQQIARVRNPGEVSVWFHKWPFKYETNFDVILDHLGRGYWVPSAMRGTDPEGRPLYNKDHALLLIWTHVICSRRSSKNKLLELFTNLRAANGWDLQVVTNRESDETSGWDAAESAVWERQVQGILAANDLPDIEVIELYEARREGKRLSDPELYELERGILRMTFNVDITDELISMAAGGALATRVGNFKEAFAERADMLTEALIKVEADGSLTLKRMKTAYLVRALMNVAGLIKDGKLDEEVRLTKQDLGVFVVTCGANRTIIEEMAGFPLRRDLKTNPIRPLNAFLGLVGLEVVEIERRRVGGKIVRFYGFVRQRLEQMRALAASYREFGTGGKAGKVFLEEVEG